jgi:hypothetical protein
VRFSLSFVALFRVNSGSFASRRDRSCPAHAPRP